MSDYILLVNLISAGLMTGLIWFVQIIHYPLMAHVSPENFPTYHQKHVRLAGFLIAPIMLTELIAALLFSFVYESDWLSLISLVNLMSVAVIWLSTFGLQVPLHSKLAITRDSLVIKQLVCTNWLRTLAWSFRFCLFALIAL